MKRLFTTLILSAIICVTASAQFKVETGINWGGYIPNTSYRGTVGTFARGLYDFRLGSDVVNDHLYIETGVGYLLNRARNAVDDGMLNAHWLQVPVLFGTDRSTDGGGLFADFGVYYGYCVSALDDGYDVRVKKGKSDYDKYVRFYKPHDFGIIGHIGYRFEMGLGIGLTYQYGLLDLHVNSKMNTSVLALSLSWRFQNM